MDTQSTNTVGHLSSLSQDLLYFGVDLSHFRPLGTKLRIFDEFLQRIVAASSKRQAARLSIRVEKPRLLRGILTLFNRRLQSTGRKNITKTNKSNQNEDKKKNPPPKRGALTFLITNQWRKPDHTVPQSWIPPQPEPLAQVPTAYGAHLPNPAPLAQTCS